MSRTQKALASHGGAHYQAALHIAVAPPDAITIMPRYTPKSPTSAPVHNPDSLPKSVQSYLDNGAAEGGRNRALFAATCQLRDIGSNPADAESVLLRRAMQDGLKEGEARACIQSAFKAAKRELPTGAIGGPPPTPRHQLPERAAPKKRDAIPQARPVPLPEAIAQGFEPFLLAAFKAGEFVAIAATKEQEDGTRTPERGVTLERDAWIERVKAKGGIDKVFTGKGGLFVRVNPIKQGGAMNEDVTHFRHVLVEFDSDGEGERIPKEKQLGVILASGLPITCIINSGNKSVHAWVRVDAKDAAEFKERAEAVYSLFEGHHLDQANKNPSRLSRCPDGWRTVDDERTQQQLLALNLGAASWADWEHKRKAAEFGEGLDFDYLLDYDTTNDPNALIGANRWLCKGGSIVIVGQAGTGKSALNLQLATGWALNRPDMSFGVAAKRPLTSLILQAENDDGDLAEAAQGVFKAFDLGPDDRAVLRKNIRWHRITTLTGEPLLQAVADLVRLTKPDICWLDPLMSYIGDDISKQEVIAKFCNNGLSAISLETGVIFAIIHHTGKPPKDAQLKPANSSDLAYAGLGSSTLTNWAREVAVLKREGDSDPATFTWTMCKRRKRAGLTHFGTSIATEQIYIRHSSDGTIRWEQCEKPAAPEKPKRFQKKDKEAKEPTTEAPAPAKIGRPAALSPEAKADIVAALDLFGGTLDRQQREVLASKWGVNPSTVFRFARGAGHAEETDEQPADDGIPQGQE